MQKEVSPVVIIGAIVVVLGLVVFGAFKAMTPHEKIVKTAGMTLSPVMQQRLALLRQRALANHAVAVTSAMH